MKDKLCPSFEQDFSYCPVDDLKVINANLLKALQAALASVEFMASATDADPEDFERLALVQETIHKYSA